MRRKTGSTLILFILLFLSCMLLYGCGGDKKEKAAPATTEETAKFQDTEQADQKDVENEEATEESRDQETTAEDRTVAPAREATSFVGKWRFYSMESDDPGMNIKHEDLDDWKEQGFDYAEGNIITFGSDGTYTIDTFGDVTKGDWTDHGDGTGNFTVEGESYEISMEGQLLVCHMKDNVTRFERME
jgi:hypothetical protein